MKTTDSTYLNCLANQSRDVWLCHNEGPYRDAEAEVESRIEYVLSLYEREIIPEYRAAYALARIMTEEKEENIGEWVYDEYDTPHCSECGYRSDYATPYCPNCGALMEED